MPNPIIQVKDLTVRFGSHTVLDGITFDVHPGEVFVILGESGCGKTVLLKHIIGLFTPDEGDILIQGESIVDNPNLAGQIAIDKFGVLYQSSALFGSMTILENVALPLDEHTDLPKSVICTLAREKLRAVGLDGVGAQLPNSLSGGMQKRAALARAMILDPPLLFLDEPSSGLDPVTSADLDQLILDLRDRYGTTMVIVSHELDSVLTVADNAILLKDARIAAGGPMKSILESEEDNWVEGFLTRKGTRGQNKKTVPDNPVTTTQ